MKQWVQEHSWELLAIIGITAVAAWLRLGWTDVTSFGFDDARIGDMALQMVHEGNFPPLGMVSSTGVPNFPAAVWLYAIPFAITNNPQLAISMTAAFNVAAVVGIYWLAQAAWGKYAGLSAALLFATSPYLVFYSRSVWSQNWLAPLAVLWAITAVIGIRHKNFIMLALFAFLSGFVGQFHLAAVSLTIPALWIGIRFRLWRQWKPITLGIIAAVAAAMPTIYTIARYGDGARVEIERIMGETAVTDPQSFTQLAQLGISHDWQKFWLNEGWRWGAPLDGLLQIASLLMGGILIIGSIILLVAMVRDLRPRKIKAFADNRPSIRYLLTAFLLVWAISAPLLFLRSKTPVHIQYQLASLPALFLIAAAFVGWVQRGRWWGMGWTAVILFVAIVQTTAIARTLNIVQTEYVDGGMGTPLRYPQAMLDELRLDNHPIVVESFGDIPEFSGDASAFKVLLWHDDFQLADARSALLIPDEPAHLLFTYDTLPAWTVADQIGLDGTIREFPRRDGELSYWVRSVDGAEMGDLTAVSPPITLENGAALLGWTLVENENGTTRLITHWQIIAPPQEGHFQQFNHLYLPDGTEPAAVQDVYTSSRAWQQGDHLITWADFEKTAVMPAYFHIGMYTWPDLNRSPVQNRDGDPLYPIQLDME